MIPGVRRPYRALGRARAVNPIASRSIDREAILTMSADKFCRSLRACWPIVRGYSARDLVRDLQPSTVLDVW
jgi:hypothetical protein